MLLKETNKKTSQKKNFFFNILTNKYLYAKGLPKRIHLNGNTVGFHPQTQKLELHTKQIVPCESTAEEVSFERLHHRISSTDSKVRATH